MTKFEANRFLIFGFLPLYLVSVFWHFVSSISERTIEHNNFPFGAATSFTLETGQVIVYLQQNS